MFTECDTDRRGALLPRELGRFIMRLAPALRPAELRSVQTHLHLLDANGNGTIEFKELLTVRRSPGRERRALNTRTRAGARAGLTRARLLRWARVAQGLRALPVRMGSKLYQRAPFKGKKGKLGTGAVGMLSAANAMGRSPAKKPGVGGFR